MCPTSYNIIDSSCIASLSTQLFYLDFSQFYTLNAISINGFSHPKGVDFIDSGRESPIPTKERGFYFVNTSRLVADESYTLAPDHSIAFLIKAFETGTVIEIVNNWTLFKIEVFNGYVEVMWNLSSNYYNETTEAKVYVSYVFGTWGNFKFHSIQYFNNVTFFSGVYYSVLRNMEFRQDYSFNTYIGGMDGASTFKGFLYKISIKNIYDIEFKVTGHPISCNLTYYFDGSCRICDSNCSDWPMCVRNYSCNVCYSINCSSCSGYLFSQCSECYSGTGNPPGCVLGLNCLSGSGTFDCISCISNVYEVVDGICLYHPYHYSSSNITSPVFSIKFDTFQKIYGDIS